ncbi:hypothetical protein [Nitrosophilus labii]|uniref:hypothetical protein n=1 Tax=Nitrosophilus labii TaxID=2706014 RepID=UPI0016573B50|nr:hypothetical protein [Nitrosophilus labii]
MKKINWIALIVGVIICMTSLNSFIGKLNDNTVGFRGFFSIGEWGYILLPILFIIGISIVSYALNLPFKISKIGNILYNAVVDAFKSKLKK